MRLVIDNKENLDANNVYLPETGGGGIPATGGQITIDSATVSNGTQASVTLDFTTINNLTYPFTEGIDILIENVTVATLSSATYNDGTELATTIRNLNISGYTLTGSGAEVVVTSNDIGFNTDEIQIYANDSIEIIKSGNFSGGSDPSFIEFGFGVSNLTFDCNTANNLPVTSGEDFRITFNGVEIALDVVASNITTGTELANYIRNLTPSDTAFVFGGSGSTLTITYKGKSTGSILVYKGAAPSTGTNLLSGSLSSASTTTLVTLTTPSQIDPTDTPTSIANKLRIALNQLITFFPDGVNNTGATLYLNTTIGTDNYNNIPPFISEVGGGSITTSGAVPMTGGVDDSASVTPSLASINKSRKGFFDGTKAQIKGFCGFVMVNEVPTSQDTQVDFFSLDSNKLVVNANNGIGFTHKIESIADGSFYFVNALRINNANQISNNLSDHFWLRISRSGTNILIDLCTLTGKTVADGWAFTTTPLVEASDQLIYQPNYYLRFIYPNSGATIAQAIVLSSLSNVVDYVNITGSKVLALNSVLDNKTFTLPHVAGNVGSDAVLTVVRADGD